ncbi:MAG TPA: TetR/AcrR family transcriptional regulator [Acidimicrobiales bacterium]|nr:TetR/AcrR family transcriptional regulator [Acidimicrobiales bacterium]
MTEATLPTDGRAARAARTRDAIVDASIALVEAGDVRPTAPRIAARAGVSVRSVFQHFDDLPSLHTAVVQRVVERLSLLVVAVDPALARDARIDAFARYRAALLEAVTPFRRAAAVHGPFAPEIREAVAQGNVFLRCDVDATFSPELDRLPPAERRELLDALAATASWGMWDSLRSEAGDSAAQAQKVLRRTLRALLTGPPPAV